MENNCFFPAVAVVEEKDLFNATAAIRLAAIQSVRLRIVSNTTQRDETPSTAYQLHRSILQSMVAWPKHITVSLNLLTVPVPDYPLSGTVEMSILITVSGTDQQVVISELLNRCANFFSLLSTFLDEAEFEVITNDKELQHWMQPFRPVNVSMIDRFHDSFTLTVKPSNKSETKQVGFLTTKTEPNNSIPVIDYIFPWQQNRFCDISTVIEALLFHPSPLWLQVRLRPAKMSRKESHRLEQSLTVCEELINGLHSNHSILSLQTQALRLAISERIWQQNQPVFQCGCFLCSESELDEAMVRALGETISPAPDAKEDPYLPLKGGMSLNPLSIEDFLDPDYFSPQGIMTVDEAACAFRIPRPDKSDPPGLPIKSFRTGLAASALLQNTTPDMLLLGQNRHRGHIHPIQVSSEDRLRHTCIMGQTGTGKSVYLESCILQDIQNNKGLCFIDPHGDSVEKILRLYPEKRMDDLILIDFLDRDRVIPFNILAWKNAEERDRIIDDLYGWLDLTYNMRQTGGPIFEQYFRAFLRLLMGDKPRSDFQPTIADFLRLFVDKNFREYCLALNEDPQVTRMIKQARNATGEASLTAITPYITSKLNRFELDRGLQVMTGQETMRLDFEEAMNNGKVMLVNLGRGRFGETVSSLLASQIISRFQSAAMKRVDMKAEDRRDFFLYVDEFQNVASEPFIAMLAEARKFRLGLILANQYADQLEQRKTQSGDSVLKAILGNVGNTTCFRLGINDAKTMADVFHPNFGPDDLVNLPIGNCYTNLKTSNCPPSSFSLETKLIEGVDRPEYVKKLRKHSNHHYTIPLDKAIENLKKHDQLIDDLL